MIYRCSRSDCALAIRACRELRPMPGLTLRPCLGWLRCFPSPSAGRAAAFSVDRWPSETSSGRRLYAFTTSCFHNLFSLIPYVAT